MKLRSSAISVEVARERGYVSAAEKKMLQRYGFSGAQRDVLNLCDAVLVIPLHNVQGEWVGAQMRPDVPRAKNGKALKYESPFGLKMLIDVPPRVHPHLGDPSRALFITEGPIKADAMVSAGLDAVALLGVWNWRGTNDDGGKVAVPDWEDIALNDRQIFVVFDSDAMLKKEVHGAMARLGAFLKHRKAHVAYVYLPHDIGNGVQKVGVDDYLAAGHTADELIALAAPELRKPRLDPSDNRATVQPLPAEPPDLARDQRILDRFKVAIHGCGVVGEETTAATLYLSVTSRLLDRPVSIAVKGHSSSGKSFTTEQTVQFFPPEAVIVMTAMSQKSIVYDERDYKHRTIVIYEVVALREGNDDDLTAYFVRSLISEGRIEYPVTVRGPDGNFSTKIIVKEGPVNVIVTTTKTQIHAENETRVLSLATDDSREQTGRVLEALANGAEQNVDLSEWRQLQAWLQHAEHRVVIPYASRLAKMIPPIAVRLRRDFGSLLALIQAHAILHQCTRDRDEQGRIIATIDDYTQVRKLVAAVIAEGVGSTVSREVKATVEAVEAIAGTSGVMAKQVADRLELDKSTVSRRLQRARDGGYIQNLEDKRGKPARWVIGDPLPDKQELLPRPDRLQPRNPETPPDQGGCTVARDPEGENTDIEAKLPDLGDDEMEF